MRRPLDTSQAKCDTCGKPYVSGDAVYTVADKFDQDIEDRDVLIWFRHWDCHTPIEDRISTLKKEVDDACKRFDAAMQELRSKLR